MGTRRDDWPSLRDTIDLAKVATRLLGPASTRRGQHGRHLWWSCPLGTHTDANPSFAVEPGRAWWRCYGCGESGDAIDLARRLDPSLSFPEAVAVVTGESPWARRPTNTPAPSSRAVKASASTRSLSPEAARELVESAQRLLWTESGAPTLAYLRGRGLTDETIRSARLGHTPKAEGVPWSPPGLVIPWFAGDDLLLVKIRPPDAWRERFPEKGRPPKYLQAFRDPDRPLSLYPGPDVRIPGRPIVVVEGELDALLLAQFLDGRAAVVTLGSASSHPDHPTLCSLIACSPWFAAHDADDAGDKAAEKWLTASRRARRARPPLKDWTEAQQAGVDLRRWWSDRLAGVENPELFTWAELASKRWGPALEGEDGPGIVIPRDWRSEVAAWPHDRWRAWRARSAEVLASRPGPPSAAEIRLADRQAYDELSGPSPGREIVLEDLR